MKKSVDKYFHGAMMATTLSGKDVNTLTNGDNAMTLANTQERKHSINGIPGRMMRAVTRNGILYHNQRWVSEQRAVPTEEYGEPAYIQCELRFDDECQNGHMDFSITGEIKTFRKQRDPIISCGCIHDAIEKHFPELAPLIKWHLCSTDGPMHYAANTTYHARTCSHAGKTPGDPVKFETRYQFGDFPMTHKLEKNVLEWLSSGISQSDNISIVTVPYDGTGDYKFGPKYSLTGISIDGNKSGKWYEAPFDSEREATEFLAATRLGWKELKFPTAWAEAVTPNLEHARSSAIWPNATLEQLQDKAVLNARLAALLDEFRTVIDSAGFIWATPL